MTQTSVASPAACPLCGSQALTPVLERTGVPVFQNALLATAVAARAAPRGDLALLRCGDCGFIHNHAFNPQLIAYGADYENDQSLSRTFARHLDAMADRVIGALPVGATVLEVGCGQGGFVRRLAQRGPGRLRAALGFDPAYRGPQEPEPGVRFEASLFDRQAAASVPGGVDAVVSRHVIEHVSDPVGFIAAIRAALGTESEARLFVETPTVDWIFAGTVLQDVFYEHCNYFTADTLHATLQAGGFIVDQMDCVFDGQYLWAEARAGAPVPVPRAAGGGQAAMRYAAAVTAEIAHWQAQLQRGSPTVVWGAGAKGVTFATTIDPDATLIAGLIDMNPGKQGRFVPVSGHPVYAPAALPMLAPRQIVIMNPNYRAEIAADVAALGITADILDG